MILYFEILPRTIFSKFSLTNISLLPKVLAESENYYLQQTFDAFEKKDNGNTIFYGEKGIEYFLFSAFFNLSFERPNISICFFFQFLL